MEQFLCYENEMELVLVTTIVVLILKNVKKHQMVEILISGKIKGWQWYGRIIV